MPRALNLPPPPTVGFLLQSLSSSAQRMLKADGPTCFCHHLSPVTCPYLEGPLGWITSYSPLLAIQPSSICFFFFFFSHPSCIYPKEALRKYPPTLTKKGAIKPSSSSSLVLMEITHRAWWLEVAVMGQSPTSSLLAMCLFQGPRTLTKGKSREDC